MTRQYLFKRVLTLILLSTFLITASLGCAQREEKTPPPVPKEPDLGVLVQKFNRSPEQAKVLATFSAYRDAIVSEDTEKALSYVSKSTFDFYKVIHTLSLSAPEDELAESPIAQRFIIGLVRANFSHADLEKMTDRDLARFSIEKEVSVKKEAFARYGLGKIKVNEKVASGEIRLQNRRAPGTFFFFKEGEDWKIDPSSPMELFDKIIKIRKMRTGETEEVTLLKMIGEASKKPVTDAIWKREGLLTPGGFKPVRPPGEEEEKKKVEDAHKGHNHGAKPHPSEEQPKQKILKRPEHLPH